MSQSRHDGVSCDACLKGNFKGRRYKCLICFDYDLCSTCYENGATTNQHTTNHPMQCILTRHDFDIFHGGEALTADQPQSLTCPFCGKMGFTEATLQEHVTANHLDTTFEVVCPICASVPGGDPNHVTDDFAAHLTLDHPSGAPRELDITESGNRHGVRRMQHQGRGLNRGVGGRQNMRFGSVSSGFFSASSRGDSMDPIAELLSQLSGVRRATAATRQQQLERLPTRRSGTGTSGISGTANNSASSIQTRNVNIPNGNNSGSVLSSNMNSSGTCGGTTQSGVVVSLGGSGSNAVASHHYPPSLMQSNKQGQSQFLLGRLSDSESDQESRCEARDLRATFVQELLLSTLSDLSLGSDPITSTTTNSTEVPPTTSDASTQTSPIVSSITPTTNTLNSIPFQTTTGSPLTKTSSSTSVTLTSAPYKGPKSQNKMVTRSSPSLQQQQQPLTLQQSNGSNLGSGRVMTGTGTVSVPPPVGAPGRGRATGGSVSPGAGRRKPVRGVDGRTTQPPPPH